MTHKLTRTALQSLRRLSKHMASLKQLVKFLEPSWYLAQMIPEEYHHGGITNLMWTSEAKAGPVYFSDYSYPNIFFSF